MYYIKPYLEANGPDKKASHMRPGHIAQAALLGIAKPIENKRIAGCQFNASPVAKIQKHKGELYVHSLS